MKKPTPGKMNRGVLSLHAEAPAVSISNPGGIMREPVTVSISSGALPEGGVIRYSLGSKEPKAASPVYTGPISINSSTVLRAAVFAPDYLPGPVSESAFVFLDPEVEAFTSNLPVVIAETAGVHIDSEYAPWMKRKYRAVHVSIFEPGSDGRTCLNVEPGFAEFGAMRVRGHSSATNFPKKQYAWEVRDSRGEDKDVSVLGLPAESDWILAAPYSDKSLMRNVLAFELGRTLLGDGGGSRTKFVEVFLNQDGDDLTMADYQGVYVLTEKIKRGPDRVPIEGLSRLVTDSVTGGYIFKIDKGLDWDEKVRTKRGALTVGFVDPDEPNPVQKAYLEQFLNAYEEVLVSDDFADETTGYAAFIDVDSFIKLDWMVEIFREIDGWWISSYFTKDRNGKMRAAPLWDYNLSLGNAHYNSGYLPTGWHRDAHPSGGHLWFRRLHDDPKYSHQSWKYYFELRKGILSTENLHGMIDGHAARVQEAADRNFRRWPVLGRYVWPNAPGYQQRRTYQEEIDWMKDWLAMRLEWIDQQYIAPPVFTESAGNVRISLPAGVKKGEIYYTIDGTDPGYRGGMKWKSLYSGVSSPVETLVPSIRNEGSRLSIEDWTSIAKPSNEIHWRKSASGAVGYETELADYAELIKHEVAEMWNTSASCYIRLPFELEKLPSAQELQSLALRIRYDDGFVAYLNGVKVAEKNAPDHLFWNASATGTTDDRNAVRWEAFEMAEHSHLLKQGQNILAIHGLNQSTSSTDALWDAQLAVIDHASMLSSASGIPYTKPLSLAELKGIQLRAVVFTGDRWGVTGDF
ncbi:MAG: CotH kinase family protein [Verrucomicrobiales bacterium]